MTVSTFRFVPAFCLLALSVVASHSTFTDNASTTNLTSFFQGLPPGDWQSGSEATTVLNSDFPESSVFLDDGGAFSSEQGPTGFSTTYIDRHLPASVVCTDLHLSESSWSKTSSSSVQSSESSLETEAGATVRAHNPRSVHQFPRDLQGTPLSQQIQQLQHQIEQAEVDGAPESRIEQLQSEEQEDINQHAAQQNAQQQKSQQSALARETEGAHTPAPNPRPTPSKTPSREPAPKPLNPKPTRSRTSPKPMQRPTHTSPAKKPSTQPKVTAKPTQDPSKPKPRPAQHHSSPTVNPAPPPPPLPSTSRVQTMCYNTNGPSNSIAPCSPPPEPAPTTKPSVSLCYDEALSKPTPC